MKFEYVYGENVGDKYPGVTHSIERITPHIAEQMLRANVKNRNQMRNQVKTAIDNGEWQLNGATIVFSDDGTLLDGQHRLVACIETGTPIVALVVRGISKSAQVTMDSGCKRSASDFLSMMGYRNASIMAAVASRFLRDEKNGTLSAVNKCGLDTLTTKEVVSSAIENETRINRFMSTGEAVGKRYKGFTKSLVIYIADLMARCGADDEDIEEFFNQLLDRSESCEAVRLLKARLIKNMVATTGKLNAKTIYALTIKAWNAYMSGESIKQLKYTAGGKNPEPLPMPLGSDV